MRLALLITALLSCAATAEPVVVLRGDRLARLKPNLADEVSGYAGRVQNALRAVGAPFRVASDDTLEADALADAKLVVLPYNQLDDDQVAALATFTGRGGRILAFFTIGSDRLETLLGVARGALHDPAYDGELDQITFGDEAQQRYPGLPPAVHQGSWHAFTLSPQPGTTVLGVWGAPPRGSFAAVTENRAGWYVGHVLMEGDGAAKGRFMVALAASLEPSIWRPVLEAGRARALAAAERVKARWERFSARADVPPERRTELSEQVFSLSVRAGALPPPVEDAAPALLAIYERLEDEASELTYRLVSSPTEELRGIWVFGRQHDWEKLVPRWKAAGLNAVFYRTCRGGNAVYPSAILPQEEWAQGTDPLAEAIAVCHRYGLELHAWRVCWHLGSAPADYRQRLRREGRISLDPNGREAPFANPGDPRNQELELAAIRELVERYDIDGVHLDYIRYTEVPSYDFDYSPVSRREFERLLGHRVANWPQEVIRGELKERYEQWLRDNINRVVRLGSAEVHQLKPHAIFSAAVWRNHRRYIYAIKQDWPLWLREGWLDLLVPMDYTTSPDDLAAKAVEQVSLAAGNTRVAIGIGSWLLTEPEQLLDQLEIARAAGSDGFVLFSSNATQIDEQLDALAQGATSQPATPTTAAPRARWTVADAVPQKDAPSVLEVGKPAQVRVDLDPAAGSRREAVTTLSARLEAVNPATGELLATLGRLAGVRADQPTLTGTIEPPEGRVQLRVRGRCEAAGGEGWDFAVHGPLLDGWSADALAAWRREQEPPQPGGDGKRVGVWADGVWCDSVLAALQTRPGVQAFPVRRLATAWLAPCQALVLPQLRDVGDLDHNARAALRAWVQRGGVLLLTHDAVGYRWHPTPFPELGWGKALSRVKEVVAAVPLGDKPAGWSFAPAYGDHVVLHPGPAAQVLVKEPDGTPVVVAGRVGAGRVVLDGLLTGAPGDGDTMPQAEVELTLAFLGLGNGG